MGFVYHGANSSNSKMLVKCIIIVGVKLCGNACMSSQYKSPGVKRVRTDTTRGEDFLAESPLTAVNTKQQARVREVFQRFKLIKRLCLQMLI